MRLDPHPDGFIVASAENQAEADHLEQVAQDHDLHWYTGEDTEYGELDIHSIKLRNTEDLKLTPTENIRMF